MRLTRVFRVLATLGGLGLSATALVAIFLLDQIELQPALATAPPLLPTAAAAPEAPEASEPKAKSAASDAAQPSARVPKVAGRRLDRALKKLHDDGFATRVVDEYDESLEPAQPMKVRRVAERSFRVITQEPRAGSTVERGTVIVLRVRDTRRFASGY